MLKETTKRELGVCIGVGECVIITGDGRRGPHAQVHSWRELLLATPVPAATTSTRKSVIRAKIRILHQVKLVNRVDHGAGAKVKRLVGSMSVVMVMLHLHVLKTHGVGCALVELIEVAPIQGYVRTAKAVSGMGWVI